MAFEQSTRHMVGSVQQSKNEGSENPLLFELTKVGLLAGLYLDITGTVVGTPVTPNPLGKAAIIRRVGVRVNGVDLHAFSGPGYHWGIRDHIDHYADPCVTTDARSAVAAGAYDVSMFVPVAINARDRAGLMPLQTDRSVINVSVEFESPANLAASGVTDVTGTVTVVPELLSMPADSKNWPEFNLLHGFMEEEKGIAVTGKSQHRLQHGNTYTQVLFLYGVGVAGADNWSEFRVYSGNEEYYRWTPNLLDRIFERSHGRARPLGLIPVDLLGSSGLGTYGSDRDIIFSPLVASLEAELNANAAPGTLRIIRRELTQVERSTGS